MQKETQNNFNNYRLAKKWPKSTLHGTKKELYIIGQRKKLYKDKIIILKKIKYNGF